MRPPGWRRLLRLDVGARHVEREVDDELAFHIEMRTRKLVAKGMDAASARAEAMRQFGDIAVVRNALLGLEGGRQRGARRARRWRELKQDLGYAVRTLRRQPVFAGVLLVSLALGMGANTAVFTLVDAILLRPLPVPHPEQLVAMGNVGRVNSLSTGGPRTDLLSVPIYRDVQDASPLLTGLLASGRTGGLDVVIDSGSTPGSGRAEHPRGRLVSGNYFSVLGVSALLGRTFTVADDRVPDGSPVVVLSQAWWKARFGGDRSVIGRVLRVNGRDYTIIGVAMPGYGGEIVGQPTDLWIPLSMQPAIEQGSNRLEDRASSWLLLMGRMTEHGTVAQVRTSFRALITRSIDAHASAAELAPERVAAREPLRVQPGGRGFSWVRGHYARPLLTLMVAVALVLLVVCANVANLLFARGVSRSRELGLRVALGAGRDRLLRQLLTETVLLAAAGGGLGLLMAWWGSTALVRLAALGPAVLAEGWRLDWRIFGFAGGLALLTVLLCGLAPALRATRAQPAAVLREQGRGVTGGAAHSAGRFAMGRVLVGAQVALSLMLLVGTSLLVRSIHKLQSQDPGLAQEQLLLVDVDVAPTGLQHPALQALAVSVADHLRQMPGVAAATFSENGIFSGTESATSLTVPGFVARTMDDTVVNYDRVGPGYFRAIGARLLLGRDIEDSDRAGAPGAAVINQTMARFYYPGGAAAGQHITVDSVDYQIVGVVADTRDHTLRGDAVRRLYLPLAQSREGIGELHFEVRAAAPLEVAHAVRAAVLAVHPQLRLLSIDPLTRLMRDSIGQDLLLARLVSFFGVLALVLAALGLYGVLSYLTAQRTSEFGLRMALGAAPRTVSRMVLGEALLLVAAGAAAGLPMSLGVAWLMRNQLFGVSPADPVSVGIALLVLAGSATCAGWLPAARAARVGPLTALRSD